MTTAHQSIHVLLATIVIPIVFLSCQIHEKELEPGIKVTGTAQPVINLNGSWKFSMNPPENFWENSVDPSSWPDIQVPGECAMQGFVIKHDTPYAYKTSFIVPEDYNHKVIRLKFDGVYSYARVWVNGNFVREHYGGFTAWECDITEFVQPGEKAWLTVEITDKMNDLSYQSGYAKHPIGGILRSVWLMALPPDYLKYFHTETDFDENYEDASLCILLQTSHQEESWIGFSLFDPYGKKVKIDNKRYKQTGSPDTVTIPVQSPVKWDAEHPHLYTLVTTLYNKDHKETYSKIQKTGFREVEVKGNKLLVNGREVRLRGACRHDIHPLSGRMTTPEYDLQDVLLAREANINFFRTSHYPPSETFLDYCDRFGIYVEDESAVCFVNTHRSEEYNILKQSGPEFTHQYLSQIEEMVHYHSNHPSVIIWSLGNESKYDNNFKMSYDLIKSIDKSRPVIFSYPGTVPDSMKCYDMVSMHYPSYRGDLDQYGIKISKFGFQEMPVLFDEWAHVTCYNKPTLLIDPNVRTFWGQSLDSMWTNLFESDGGSGGAIWGMIDETFMMPDTTPGFNEWWDIMDTTIIPKAYEGPCIGYGEWGIVDTWRRKKPEFWNTKKAYSPVKVMLKEIPDFQPSSELKIPLYNRFDHTNLKELKIIWNYKDISGTLKSPDIPPHAKGELEIPGNNWENGEYIHIQFYQNDTFLIDEYNIRFGKREINLPVCKEGYLHIEEQSSYYLFSDSGSRFKINKTTGLMEDWCAGKDTLIKSGPWLNLKVPGKYVYYSTIVMDDLAADWKLSDVSCKQEDGMTIIRTRGHYGKIEVNYTIQPCDQGILLIDYEVSNAPDDRKTEESGIMFITGNNFDRISWDRDAYWTAYPDMHLGMPEGEVEINKQLPVAYRSRPENPWEEDTKDFYYHGIDKQLSLTNVARALKENIYSYSLKTRNNNSLRVLSDGTQACRFDNTKTGYILYINSQWDYADLLWGNYMKNIQLNTKFRDRVILGYKRADG